MTLPTTLDVYIARRRLQGRLTATPLRHSAWLSDRTGASVFLKLEALNLTGSFKIRGAFNSVLALMDEADRPTSSRARAPRDSRPLIVAASAGNHGRALALATEELGFRCAVFTPFDAPDTKKAGIRRHGAVLFDDHADYDLAESRAKAYAQEEGGVYVSPYAHRDVIAGAGTMGLEIVEALPACDVIVVPIGGGGMASGIGLAVKAAAPARRLVGVEVDASTPFTQSLEAGHIVQIRPRPSLADGLTGNLEPDAITFPLVRDVVDEIVTVGEDDLARAMRGIGEHEHLIVEGSAATAVAALLSSKIHVAGKKVAVIVTGSNVDFEKWRGVVDGGS